MAYGTSLSSDETSQAHPASSRAGVPSLRRLTPAQGIETTEETTVQAEQIEERAPSRVRESGWRFERTYRLSSAPTAQVRPTPRVVRVRIERDFYDDQTWAAVEVWDVSSWSEISRLRGHELAWLSSAYGNFPEQAIADADMVCDRLIGYARQVLS